MSKHDEVKTSLIRITHHSAAHVAQHWPYAAYGSNLWLAQMAERCQRPEVMTSGKLIGHRLIFAKVASIIEDKDSTVPVGIYKLTPADVERLDRNEGLGRAYDRYLVTPFTEDGRALRCFTYIKRDQRPGGPTDKYYAKLLAGYRDWHFDDRRLRHARKAAIEAETKDRLAGRAAHNFINDGWRVPVQQPLSYETTTVPSLVTGRPISVPKYATANLNNVEWGQRDNDMFWRVQGTRQWYRDLSTEADIGSNLVRGEIIGHVPGAPAFKPKDQRPN